MTDLPEGPAQAQPSDRPTKTGHSQPSDRPTPTGRSGRPSPTSRARRTAAVAAQPPTRRPSPGPAPAGSGALSSDPVADRGAVAVEDRAVEVGTEQPGTRQRRGEPAAESAESTGALQPSEASRPSHRRAPLWLVAALAVVVLAAAALDGWLLLSKSDSGSKTQREQALSSAKSAVPVILSYRYNQFDGDVSAAKAQLTGRASTDYVQAMAKTVKPTATKVHAVVQAQTDAAGVESVAAGGKQVTVVVFGEQKVTNTSLTAPRTDLFRVRVTMDRVGGRWLISKFDQI
jgi:Mce-associated membrane protein